MNHLDIIQGWLRSSELAGIIVSSQDEFLSEFAPPANRRLRWATGFRGSTGLAVILRETASLFLDGRYAVQGAADTAGTEITIEVATRPARYAWLKRFVPTHASLGIDPWCHSALELEQWRMLAEEVGFELRLLSENPIDRLWSDARPPPHRPWLVDYPIEFAGDTYETKCAALREHVKAMGLRALLVADPEDVSWLLNTRADKQWLRSEVDDWHVVPSSASRVLVEPERIRWFVERELLSGELRLRGEDIVAIAEPEALVSALREVARDGSIGMDYRRTPAALADIVEGVGRVVPDDTAARCRWRKHPAEVLGARRAHIVDAAAVIRFMAWLSRTVPQRSVSEFEAAQKLQALRSEHPDFDGPSMPLMSASGASGAQPHYVPPRDDSRLLNEHPIYWMDSGGQYFGGSTDNTLTLALGAPAKEHVLAHTLVLKGYIALATARFPAGTTGLRLDPVARMALWQHGMDYAHGTGHGVGNYLNIHEGPSLAREPTPMSTVPLEPGMIVTNEPAYYEKDNFGLRIESHMAVVPSRHPDFLEFDTISRLPIDPRLVDFARITEDERQWLASYHGSVLRDVEPLLDADSAIWLRELVRAF